MLEKLFGKKKVVNEKKVLTDDVEWQYKIKACIGTSESFSTQDKARLKELEALNIDYYGNPKTLKKDGHLNAGKMTYVISRIDDHNKGSRNYKNCTGIVFSGVHKKTGKNISFLTHQDPWEFLYAKKDQYEDDLKQTISKFISLTKPDTVDAMIFGGWFIDEPSGSGKAAHDEEYKAAVNFIEDITKEQTGRSANVLIGPSVVRGAVHVVFDNENRRLYVERPEQAENGNSTGSFPASEVTEESKKWK